PPPSKVITKLQTRHIVLGLSSVRAINRGNKENIPNMTQINTRPTNAYISSSGQDCPVWNKPIKPPKPANANDAPNSAAKYSTAISFIKLSPFISSLKNSLNRIGLAHCLFMWRTLNYNAAFMLGIQDR